DGELHDQQQLGGGAGGLHGDERDADLRAGDDGTDDHGAGGGGRRGRGQQVGRADAGSRVQRGDRMQAGAGDDQRRRRGAAGGDHGAVGGRWSLRGDHGPELLHSSPTRRSSDLDGELHDQQRLGGGAGGLHGDERDADLRAGHDGTEDHGAGGGGRRGRGQ